MNMKRILPLLLSLAMALALCACGSQSSSDGAQTSVSGSTGVEDGVLTVGMECAYAPYNWTQMDDSNGAVPISNVPGSYANGYDVMIAKKICEANGWKLEIVSSAWESLTPAVQAGSMDANIAGQSMTADRLNEVDMAGPYYYANTVCLTTKDSPYANAKSIADLAGGRCTSQSGTNWYDSCLPQITGANIIAPADSAPAMIMQLQTGTVDFVCTDMPTAKAAAARDDNLVILDFSGTGGDFQYPSEEKRAEEVNIGIAVRKGNTTLKDAINSVLETMPPRRLQRPHGSGHRHPARGVNSADIPMRGGPAGPPHRLKGASVWIS